jgi:hypothetical protein
VPIFLKKPFLKSQSRGDRVRLALFFVLAAFAASLFLLPQDSLAVLASGGAETQNSLFGLVSRFA